MLLRQRILPTQLQYYVLYADNTIEIDGLINFVSLQIVNMLVLMNQLSIRSG